MLVGRLSVSAPAAREEGGQLGREKLRSFLRDEMAAGRGRCVHIGGPLAPHSRGVGQLRLIFAGNDECRTLDAPSGSTVSVIVLTVQPEAGAVIGADSTPPPD
jgi:hypothetical protein